MRIEISEGDRTIAVEGDSVEAAAALLAVARGDDWTGAGPAASPAKRPRPLWPRASFAEFARRKGVK